jgi:hypothetical protein
VATFDDDKRLFVSWDDADSLFASHDDEESVSDVQQMKHTTWGPGECLSKLGCDNVCIT